MPQTLVGVAPYTAPSGVGRSGRLLSLTKAYGEIASKLSRQGTTVLPLDYFRRKHYETRVESCRDSIASACAATARVPNEIKPASYCLLARTFSPHLCPGRTAGRRPLHPWKPPLGLRWIDGPLWVGYGRRKYSALLASALCEDKPRRLSATAALKDGLPGKCGQSFQ